MKKRKAANEDGRVTIFSAAPYAYRLQVIVSCVCHWPFLTSRVLSHS